jgi:hypothetical protein
MVELENTFTEAVREFAKPLFTTAIWKAGIFFIEADSSQNSARENQILDLCVEEAYESAVSKFKDENHNSIAIAMKMEREYSLKALKEEVRGYLRISYCLL